MNFAVDSYLSRFSATAILFLLLLLTLPASQSLSADETVTRLVPRSDAVAARFSTGLLWRIGRDGIEPSYLFGTYHSEDPRVSRLPETVQPFFDASDNLIIEVDLGPATRETARQIMFYQDGRTLLAAAGKELYQAAAGLLATYNLPVDIIMQLKPWAAFMILNYPRAKTGRFLDYNLYLDALSRGKPVLHLESPDEQLAGLDNLPLSWQNRLLEFAVQNHPQLEQQLQEVTRAYMARDLESLAMLTEKYTPHDDPAFTALMQNMLEKRNQRMLQRIDVVLQYGNAFIAVGALHLAGNGGLLSQLEQRGYSVTRVY